jgi:hypothetical protein
MNTNSKIAVDPSLRSRGMSPVFAGSQVPAKTFVYCHEIEESSRFEQKNACFGISCMSFRSEDVKIGRNLWR